MYLSISLLLIKPVMLGIFLSIAFNSAFVANPLTLGNFVAKLIKSEMLPSI